MNNAKIVWQEISAVKLIPNNDNSSIAKTRTDLNTGNELTECDYVGNNGNGWVGSWSQDIIPKEDICKAKYIQLTLLVRMEDTL